MKKISLIIAFLVTAILVSIYFSFHFNNEKGLRKTKAKPASHKHEFNDYFFSVRNYPEAQPDLSAYLDDLRQIKAAKNVPNRRSASAESWTNVGPTNIGGRVNCVVVHPDNEDIIYFGAAKGGVFKTLDGGENWEAIFDDQLLLSIGDITLDPQNPEIVYVGTGDPNISVLPSVGDGIYKSMDGGASWENIGLAETRIISMIKVHPTNSQIIYVATMGLPYERNEDRGLYKTVDGGETWEQVLFISDEAGVIDLEMNFENPDVLYAVGWNRIRNNTESITTGLAAKIYKTIDGGANWEILTGTGLSGLPQTEMSRISLAMSHQNPDKLYARYVNQNEQFFNIYETVDGGESWTAWDRTYIDENGINPVGGFGWFFGHIEVDFTDDDVLYLSGVDLWRITDTGFDWSMAAPPWWEYIVHADKHDMVFVNASTFLVATDGGLYRTENGGQTWQDIENTPITQFYHIAAHPTDPNFLAGGAQDNGTNFNLSANSTDWERRLGGDGFTVQFNPENPNIIYAEIQRGNLQSTTDGGLDWNTFTDGIDQDDRIDWDMPYMLSQHDPNVLYAGTHRVYKTDNGPVPTWYPISEQLTDEPVLNNRYHVLTEVGESPLNPDVIYVGSVDANVAVTFDGGTTWEQVADNGLPVRYVSAVKGSYVDDQTFYVAHSGYKDNDNTPHLHKTLDGGQSWTSISGNLPAVPINELLIFPFGDDQIMFIATDGGVFYTSDGGAFWEFLGLDLPLVSVFDLDFSADYQFLYAGTFARSSWSYPLEEIVAGFIDTEAPELFVDGALDFTIEEGETIELPLVTAIDDFDGDITDQIEVDGAVDTEVPGLYVIVYTITDSNNNTNTLSITVTVLDTTAPELVYDGETAFEINQGEEWTNPIVGASDATDGDLSDAVEIIGEVDTSTPGEYTLVYAVSDMAGNTDSISITVNVIELDVNSPVFNLSDTTLVVLVGEELMLPEITAFDEIDGDLTIDIVAQDGGFDNSVPGTYNLTYEVSDAAGNTTFLTISIVVEQISSLAQLKAEMKVYPNPVYNVLNVDFPESVSNQIKEMTLIGIDGRLIKTTRESFNKIDVSILATGQYFVVVKLKSGVKFEIPFVKK